LFARGSSGINLAVNHRFASIEDCSMLAELNQQLLEDEGHRTRKSISELKKRMEEWLTGDYKAVIFERGGKVVGYALYRPDPEQIYLRQHFIVRGLRRRGFGREAVRILRDRVWPKDTRLTVDVLVTNSSALQFWRAAGYRDYCLTLEILPAGS
jgi:predicted acetyltransferase